MNEDLHLPGQPRCALHRRDQRCVVTGLVLGHQVGAAAPVDPRHVDSLRCGQFDLVVGAADLDKNLPNGVVGQRFQGRADRRNRRLVAREQMPVRRRVGRVGAARSHQVGGLARCGRGGPRPRDAVVAVHHEVDGNFSSLAVDASHGVRAHGGLLLGRKGIEAVECQRLWQGGDVNAVGDEHDLDVCIGEVVVVRRRQADRFPIPIPLLSPPLTTE